MEQTRNHEYETPPKGETEWHIPLNRNFESIDQDVIVKGTHADRPGDPPTDTWYLSTDRNRLSHYDGSEWGVVGGVGTDGHAVPGTAHHEAVATEELSVGGETATSLSDVGDGVALQGVVEGLEPSVDLPNGTVTFTAGTVAVPDPDGPSLSRIVDVEAATVTVTGDATNRVYVAVENSADGPAGVFHVDTDSDPNPPDAPSLVLLQVDTGEGQWGYREGYTLRAGQGLTTNSGDGVLLGRDIGDFGFNYETASKPCANVGIGRDISGVGQQSVAIGANISGEANRQILIGAGPSDEGPENVTIGFNNHCPARNSVCIGSHAGNDSQSDTSWKGIRVMIGSRANAAANGTSVGPGAGEFERASEGIAIGRESGGNGHRSISVGNWNTPNGARSIAIGTGATVEESADGGVAIGDGVSVGTAGVCRIGDDGEDPSPDQLVHQAADRLADGDFEPNEATLVIDEDNGQFVLKGKDSGGTVHTAELSWR